MLAPAQERGTDRQVQLVDQPRAEILANGGSATPESDILGLSRLLRALQRCMDAIGHEVESGSALHREGLTSMLRQHEDGYVVGRALAPPSLPTVVGPGAPHRPEHVAAHDPSADVLEAARGKVVVD